MDKYYLRNRKFPLNLTVVAALFFTSLLPASLSQAQDATIADNVLSIPVLAFGGGFFSLDLTIVADTDPVELELSNAVELSDATAEGASTFVGTTLFIPSIRLGDMAYQAELTLVSDDPVRFRLASAELVVSQAPPIPPAPVCTRPPSDISQNLDNPPIIGGATVPLADIVGGGPGPDGIPPLEMPRFIDRASSILNATELVIGVKIGNDIRAYPHNVMNWHEVANDQFMIDGAMENVTLNYCPLTGSAMLWKAFMEPGNQTFGTSGLLYNSNLIMYDRRTGSLWSQMLEQSIFGAEIQKIPDRIQVVETSWKTWRDMYPETLILSENTGFSSRDYSVYPYGSFREDQSVLFVVDNLNDNRLHRKERVVGINVGSASKVYPIRNFTNEVEVINDTVGDMQVVAAGSRGHNFGVIFNRELEDCTVLNFEPIQNKLPVMMQDNEGNEWDIFGTAVSGARTGQQLEKTNSYIAYWYAWTAFFTGAEIHQ